MNLATLTDEYLYEVARLYAPATEKKYGQVLDFLLRDCGDKTPIESVTESDVLACLSRWKNRAKATQALHISIFKGCFEYAVEKGYLQESPARRIKRPKLPKLEDRKVVIVSTGDVKKMFGFCRDWGDEICLGILAYTGARRNAVSMIRWKDVHLKSDPPHGPHGWITMQEKGNKFVDKPIPFFLREIIDRAPEHEAFDYLVPNKRPASVRRKERSNDIIYDRVKDIAKRAGVEAHVHALRSAFAVFFLENHRGSVKSLQTLLGHESIETTRHYTRNLNRKLEMSEVVDMDWGALSEGVGKRSPVRKFGDTPAPSLSALSEGATGVLAAPPRAGAQRVAVSRRPDPGAKSHHTPASSESALPARHEIGHKQLAAHHVFPGEDEKAHTGFEPVLVLQESIHALSMRIGHHFGHRTGHYPSVC